MPTGSQVSVPIVLGQGSSQPMVEVNVGGKTFKLLMDTGSSWMVINVSDIEGAAYTPMTTDKPVTVEYGGGKLTATGPVCTAEVSIGGLSPLPVKFLLRKTGSYGESPEVQGTIGINTWLNPATQGKLDIPIQALKIDQYEITLPDKDGGQGTLVLNGQPTITAARPASLMTFDVPEVASQNHVLVKAQLSHGSSRTEANLLLDSGTPGPSVHLWTEQIPGLNYSSSSTENLIISVTTTDGKTWTLPPVSPSNVVIVSNKTVIGGTGGVLGSPFIRPYVMGVDLSKGRITLLSRPPQKAAT
jgi:hypothetical protein